MARSRYEAQAQRELEADEWIVDNKAGMGRWAKNRDYFNLFDLMAVRPRSRYVRFISIKGHIGGSQRTAHVRELRRFYLPRCCRKELWIMPNTKQRQWVKRHIP